MNGDEVWEQYNQCDACMAFIIIIIIIIIIIFFFFGGGRGC